MRATVDPQAGVGAQDAHVRVQDAHGPVRDRGRQTSQLAQIQRGRLLAGAVCAIDELGYAATTVEHITARSGVSRRTFYELFSNREECLAAVLEDAVERVRGEFAALGLAQLGWRERVRRGLAALLALFDREPALARVCVVQAPRSGPRVLARREQILAQLVAAIDEGRRQGPRGSECTPLTAEGLVGAAVAIVHSRLLGAGREPLVALYGELMRMIVLPYLGAAAARREQERSPRPDRNGAQERRAPQDESRSGVEDPLRDLPMRLTYRTACVLEGIAEHPGSSNRAIAAYAGVADQGQISKLLARLERVGLLANNGSGHAKGEPNAWRLTARGAQVAQSIRIRKAA